MSKRRSLKARAIGLGLALGVTLGAGGLFNISAAPQANMRRPRLFRPQQAAPRPGEPIRREQRAELRNDQPEGLGAAGRPFFTRMQILQALNLNPEQLAKIRDLRETLGARVQVLRDSLEEKRDALNLAMYGESVDYKSIEGLASAMKDIQGQVLQLETRVEIAFRGILTPDQLSRLRELQAEEQNVRRLQRELRKSERALRQKIRNPPGNERQPQ